MFDVVTELLTAKLLRSPTLVMLGWAAPETTRATVAFATFPVTFEPMRLDRPEPFPDTFETEITEGKSELTKYLKSGAPDPNSGPAKT